MKRRKRVRCMSSSLISAMQIIAWLQLPAASLHFKLKWLEFRCFSLGNWGGGIAWRIYESYGFLLWSTINFYVDIVKLCMRTGSKFCLVVS